MSLRVRAFLRHFSLSAFVAALSMGVVFLVWYPAPLYKAMGVVHVFVLVLLVDVFLGPVLTILVFDQKKKFLWFDLSMVVVIQIAGLAYGFWVVAEGRPAWLVFNVDRFDVVRVVDIDLRKISEASEAFREPSWCGPKWAIAVQPESLEERSRILFESLGGGVDIAQRPNLYRSMEQYGGGLQARLRSLKDLEVFNSPADVGNELQRFPSADAWLPLMASVRPMVVLFSRKEGRPVGIVDLRPW